MTITTPVPTTPTKAPAPSGRPSTAVPSVGPVPQPGPSVGPQLQHEIEQFLYFEVGLLDDHRYREWWELFTEDIHYWMPIRYNRLFRESDRATGGPDELATYDEDKLSLYRRVYRLQSPSAWAEDPPSRTRHMIGNVWARPAGDDARPAGSGGTASPPDEDDVQRDEDDVQPDEYDVQSAFLVYRNRGDHEVDIWAGRRDDVLRRADGVWQIARRSILIDQATILAPGLTIFF